MHVDPAVFKVKASDSLAYAASEAAGTGLCSLLVVRGEMENRMVEATGWETNPKYLKPSQKKG